MKLVVGLGNPGPQYETTRHNAGFLAIDQLIDIFKASGPSNKNKGEVYDCQINFQKVALIKPMTYMNLSGQTVGPLFKFYKCQPEDLIVVHDDLDLEFGRIKLKTGGGTGGHNGLKSIDECIGGANRGYHRVRIGVGRPQGGSRVVKHVLDQFSEQECQDLGHILDRAVKSIELIVAGKMRDAMNQYNQKEL